ncbi:hypothetical protein PS689_05506 [Pseudomonas fluorescens]|nr:hypothetical protein PS689_05506 [Pseudomonas fluorescens]
MAIGDFMQGRVVQQITRLADRAVRHQRQVTIGAPQHQVELDATLLRVVQHLIGGATRVVQLDHVRHVEIGNAPGTDLAFLAQTFERFDGLGQRVLARPVQQIKIDVIGIHPTKAGFAGFWNSCAAGVVWIDLADDEHLVALPGNGLPYDFLGAAVGIHFSGVDQGQALFDAATQPGNFGRA